MGRLVRSPDAQRDIDDIGDRIAADSVDNAVRWLLRLNRFLRRVSDAPGIGTARDELSPGLRSVPFGMYVVFFRRIDRGVEIVRVIHGRRDIERFF